MRFKRSSGILLHPTSLPGAYGIGDLGTQALRWIDFLFEGGCALWQVLPLGPTGYGDSPYQCFSAFAGNPLLISPETLLREDLLHSDDLVEMPSFPEESVDYGTLIHWKLDLLNRSYLRFKNSAADEIHQSYENFCVENADWLEDYSLFMALKEANGGAPWVKWKPALRARQPGALEIARNEYPVAIQRQKYRQFIFFRQWGEVKRYAHQRGITIIGDIPIFVAHDSADVWANPELFYLDSTGMPSVVAGVPPDYFSSTGQLWGNPLYRWEVHQQDGYRWWQMRIKATLDMVDCVRLDHFRGFAGYWEVPGGALTAEHGRWVEAPGFDFFQAVEDSLGDLPIIAEDLGVITEDVIQLRENFRLPGMKILQFAFEGGPKDPFLPHQYPPHCVVYTGTHDNDTACGWYERVDEKPRGFCRRYLNSDGTNIAWDMVRACWGSVAVYALAPMQDFLGLGNEARMNYPGNPSGNWRWRMSGQAMSRKLASEIRELNYLFDRLNSTTDLDASQ